MSLFCKAFLPGLVTLFSIVLVYCRCIFRTRNYSLSYYEFIIDSDSRYRVHMTCRDVISLSFNPCILYEMIGLFLSFHNRLKVRVQKRAVFGRVFVRIFISPGLSMVVCHVRSFLSRSESHAAGRET